MKYSEIQRVIGELSLGELQDHPAIVEAQNTGNNKVMEIVAVALVQAQDAIKKAAAALSEVAHKEVQVTAADLEELAVIAEEFDNSGDPLLEKQASVLDFVLQNFAVGGPLATAKLSAAKESDRLTSKYRQESHERAYVKPREAHEEDIKAAEAVKAIKRDIKSYRPLEAPLSTRHCPDHPGVSVQRVGEHTYQCPLDKAIYNHVAGYRTMKGNNVPGGSVEGQTQGLGARNLEQMSFSTRDSALQNMV